MSRKRIYPKTSGYWIYAHTTPNGMYYIGISSQQPRKRWAKALYKESALEPYITEYGWENIQHKVLIDGLTKEQAEAWEDRFIVALSMNCLCINENRSGGIYKNNKQAYHKQYKEEHKEELKAYYKQHNKQYREDHKEEIKKWRKQYDKQRLSTPEVKIYKRVQSYNRNHTPIETPLEAKRKYIETGYIPSYIKNDDLI